MSKITFFDLCTSGEYYLGICLLFVIVVIFIITVGTCN